MSDSILLSVKKTLGLSEDYTAFDTDVVMYINSALGELHQLGVGPDAGLVIMDDIPTWDDLVAPLSFGDDTAALTSIVQPYVYLRVRLLFDPPQTSFLVEAMEAQVDRLEWRIQTFRETHDWVEPVYEDEVEAV
jgi:hypothetical protein